MSGRHKSINDLKRKSNNAISDKTKRNAMAALFNQDSCAPDKSEFLMTAEFYQKENAELKTRIVELEKVVDAVNGEVTCLLQIASSGITTGMIRMRSSESGKQTKESVKLLFEALNNLNQQRGDE